MARFFKRSTTKKTNYTISPKEAEKIIHTEFNKDDKKFNLDFIFKPHSPNEGFIKFEHKEDKENGKQFSN